MKKSQRPAVEQAPHMDSTVDSFNKWLLKSIVASIVMVAVSMAIVAIFKDPTTPPATRVAVPQAWRGTVWASERGDIELDIPLDVDQPIELYAGAEWGRLEAIPRTVSADGKKVECTVKCSDHGHEVGRLELAARGKNKFYCIFTYRDENDNPGKLAWLLATKPAPATL
jgi:hypothetical protein